MKNNQKTLNTISAFNILTDQTLWTLEKHQAQQGVHIMKNQNDNSAASDLSASAGSLISKWRKTAARMRTQASYAPNGSLAADDLNVSRIYATCADELEAISENART